MIYKKNRSRDWVFWLDWFMVFFLSYLNYNAIFVVGLKVWNWGFINLELVMTLIIGLTYMIIRLYINQNRMYELFRGKKK